MFDTPFTKKDFILIVIFAFIILTLIIFYSTKDKNTKVVFCDVGQGDGAYIRIKNQTDILIDAGPGRKILDCLGKYMPFYDRSIELAILTHAQKDHFGGFGYILDRYDIKKFWMGEVYNGNKSFAELLAKIKADNILVEFPKSGDISILTDVEFDFLWPSENYIAQNSFLDNSISYPYKNSQTDLNDFSLIFSLQLPEANILFTGDATPKILNRLMEISKLKTDILKIPHHGSKNGLTLDFLRLADPAYGVISLGSNNTYGHPNATILDMLKTQNVKIKRTDEEGNIFFSFN